MLPVRRDPAPSRVKYRLERLWLTPLVRRLVRTGLPLAAAGFLAATVATDPRVQSRAATLAETVREGLATHPDLTVRRLVVDGASPDLAARIEAALALELPASALDLDLAALRAAVAGLAPVAAAEARFRDDGALAIRVTERVPVALRPAAEGFDLIDISGARAGGVAVRTARADLPVLAGEGAADHVAEALRLLEIAAPLGPRLRGLVRVGERRWDIALAPGLTVHLPETAPEAALRRLLALHAARDLLDRDLVAVDLRDPARPVVRLSPAGLAAFRAARSPEPDDET